VVTLGKATSCCIVVGVVVVIVVIVVAVTVIEEFDPLETVAERLLLLLTELGR
jgi:hypothetical protein